MWSHDHGVCSSYGQPDCSYNWRYERSFRVECFQAIDRLQRSALDQTFGWRMSIIREELSFRNSAQQNKNWRIIEQFIDVGYSIESTHWVW